MVILRPENFTTVRCLNGRKDLAPLNFVQVLLEFRYQSGHVLCANQIHEVFCVYILQIVTFSV